MERRSKTIKTNTPLLRQLSRRERQIMDVIYKLRKATVVEVMNHLQDEVGNSTVRKQLNILEEKGYLKHGSRKNSNIYFPTIKTEKAGNSAMEHLLSTFFQGSVSQAFITLLNVSEGQLTKEDKKLITNLVNKSREEGR